jgi:hypothetical protein
MKDKKETEMTIGKNTKPPNMKSGIEALSSTSNKP